MKLKKLFSVITASVCSASMILSGSVMLNAQTDAIKIMSIGDSITDGYGTNGSYRKFLYKSLTDSGYNIDMVGPNWSWGDDTYTDSETGESFTYDAAHCGYSGYSIKDYSGRNGIMETIQNGNYLSEYAPDIVILQIGTNDVIDNHEIDTAGERLEDLANYILENISDNSALFITTIPDLDPNRSDVYSWFGNYRHSADWQTNYSDEEVEKSVQKSVDNYNSQVKALVESKQASGVSNIYYGNVNSAVTDVIEQLKDGVHPNDKGYKLMGEYWTVQINNYLSNEDPTEPTQPATEETVATDPTEPSTEETIATDPTEPSTEETIATDPTEPSTEETVATDPTEPSTEETSTTEPVILTGDLNDDKEVNVTDLVILSKFLIGDKNTNIMTNMCDINADGKINVFDMITLKMMLIEIK